MRTSAAFPPVAFQLTYTAALQATFAVLAAHGLRVKSTANHYNAFFALQKLEDALRPHAILFDGLRTTRHASVYEATADEVRMTAQLEHAFKVLPPGLSAIRASIISARPALTTRLARIS